MSRYRSILDLDVNERRLLVRVDFNVPLSGDNSQVACDRRLRAALPTIRHALDRRARVVLMSHLGRPGGTADPRFGLGRVAERLQELIDDASVRLVSHTDDAAWRNQQADEILLLDNLRFDPGEERADDNFAAALSRLGDIYVNDAFANCHRKHASMVQVPTHFEPSLRVIGLHVRDELEALDDLLETNQRPLVVALGGAKVATKIGVIETLLDRAEFVLIGGLMAYTFMHAKGQHVGASAVDGDGLQMASRLMERAGDKIVLPVDHIIAARPDADAQIESAVGGIPPNWYGVDIGPSTVSAYSTIIERAEVVVWNGPMGKFEQEPFRRGTEGIAHALAHSQAKTIVGGGESGQAIDQFHLSDRISHLSTGGGAFLKYLQDRRLPALSVIEQTNATPAYVQSTARSGYN